jgi:hypothetical protein
MARAIPVSISVLVTNPLGKMALKDKRPGRHMFMIPIADYELKFIRDALQRGQVTGGNKFQQEISKNTWHSFIQERTRQTEEGK